MTFLLKTTAQWGSTEGAPSSSQGKVQQQDADLSDLLSLLSGSTGQETTESFQEKMMNKFVHPIQAKIKSAAVEVAEFEERKKVKFNSTAGGFSLDYSSVSWPQDGKELPPNQRDSLLLLDLAYKMQKEEESKSLNTAGNLTSQSSLTAASTSSTSTVSNGSAMVRYFYHSWPSEINHFFLISS